MTPRERCVGVGLGEDDVVLGHAARWRSTPSAAEPVAAVDPDCAVVRWTAASEPDARLGGRQRGHRRVRSGERRSQRSLLLRGAELEHRVGEEPVGAVSSCRCRVAAAQLLLHQALGEHVGEAAAAVLLGEHETGDADLGGLAPQIPWRLDVRLVDRAGPRPDLLAGERAAEVDDVALLGRERDQLGGELGHGASRHDEDGVTEPSVSIWRRALPCQHDRQHAPPGAPPVAARRTGRMSGRRAGVRRRRTRARPRGPESRSGP